MGGRSVGPWRRGVAGCTGTGGAITFFRGSESKRRETEGLERESDGRWEDKVRRVPHMWMALAARCSAVRHASRFAAETRREEQTGVDFNHSDLSINLLCIRNWGIPFFLDQELLLLIDKENIRYRLTPSWGFQRSKEPASSERMQPRPSQPNSQLKEEKNRQIDKKKKNPTHPCSVLT